MCDFKKQAGQNTLLRDRQTFVRQVATLRAEKLNLGQDGKLNSDKAEPWLLLLCLLPSSHGRRSPVFHTHWQAVSIQSELCQNLWGTASWRPLTPWFLPCVSFLVQ